MSQRIAILPENITNKIAAGEVVERPASVIKELIENALDADATEISIEVMNGGRRLIKISDNGHGMSREDALLSLERHATSKIRNDTDLDGITTLGFRGEALPSIASVSRLRLNSREADSNEGMEITVEGGRVKDVKACGMAPGTVITVEHLFFNTPARQKFMRSPETESGHIADTVTRMAISRPEIAFTLVNDGREVLQLQRGNLLRRLSQAIGKESVSHLHPIEFSSNELSITGFISSPSLVRSTSASIFTFINGRFIRDKVIQHAIMQAYRGVIDRGRYPLVALFIKIQANEVDVNVHPTKHEVRFRRQALVHDTLQNAIAGQLARSPWLENRQQTASAERPTINQAYRERIAAAAQRSLKIPKQTIQFHTEHSVATQPPQPSHQNSDIDSVHEATPPFAADNHPKTAQGYFSSLNVIGQFHGEYILCQSGAELIIIDQHAASERVAYQRLLTQKGSGSVESQQLLFPETAELSFSETAAVKRFQDELSQMGFEVEPFGGNTVILSAIPRLAETADKLQLLRDILAELTQLGSSSAFQEAEQEIFSRIACHSVVRGVKQLEIRQIIELLRSMDETDFAATCPHGRPVSHTITLKELEKIFKRI